MRPSTLVNRARIVFAGVAFLAAQVCVLNRTMGQTWTFTEQLPNSGSAAGIFGDRLVTTAGQVYEKNLENEWKHVASLATADPESFSWIRVRLFGDTVLFGDPRAAVNGIPLAGAWYAFERDASGDWIEGTKIVEPLPTSQQFFGEYYGSLFDRTAILNDWRQNNTYVFEHAGSGQWTHTGTLTPSGALPSGYRGSVIFGDTAIVGARFGSEPSQSAAHVFQRDAQGKWNEAAKLTPADSAANFAVTGIGAADLYGNTAIVGAQRAAYIFERDQQGNWAQVAKLMAAENPNVFGGSVRVFGDTAFVFGGSAGLGQFIYVFRRGPQNNWNEIAKLAPPNLAPGYSIFAFSTFADAAVMSIGGSQYLYEVSGIAPGDYNRSGTIEQRDLDLVLANWNTTKAYPPLGWYSQIPKGAIDQPELDRVVLNWPATSGPLNLTAGLANGALAANLDLRENSALIDYTVNSPAETVRQQILTARGGPGLGKTWNGNGISSSAAAAANAAEPESRSIGYAENSALPLGPYTMFRGQPVDDTSLLIAYTRTGDANLDGLVNDDDVTIVGATYAPGVPQPHWALGDFDYNGFVDDDDVTLLGVFYDPSAQPLIALAEAANHVAAIPEPRTSLLIVIALAALVPLGIARLRKTGFG
jgi:hypothetical protein